MYINVACCVDVTVTQPLLDFLQAHAIGIEQTGAAMADRESGYASSGVRPENPGNADSESRAESAFPSGLHLRLELFLTRTFNAICRVGTDHADLKSIL